MAVSHAHAACAAVACVVAYFIMAYAAGTGLRGTTTTTTTTDTTADITSHTIQAEGAASKPHGVFDQAAWDACMPPSEIGSEVPHDFFYTRPGLSAREVARRKMISDFIWEVPKAELHVHIEGTLEPEMLLKLAQRNGLPAPFPSVEAARKAYNFKDLQSFLDIYYKGAGVLRKSQDFYDLAWAYFKTAAHMNVTHVEFFFDPQTHLENGIPWTTFMEALEMAAQDAKSIGVDARPIMCFLRHLPEDQALTVWEESKEWQHVLSGVGLDSSERDHPPSQFRSVMAKAREAGMKVCAHAGEEGPAAFVWDALNVLHADRIDHGIHSVDSPALMEYLADKQTGLTVCPMSNVKLKVMGGGSELKDSLSQLFSEDANLVAMINSDDPAYFSGYLVTNYQWTACALQLGIPDLARLAANSFKAAFLPEAQKAAYIATVAEVEARYLAAWEEQEAAFDRLEAKQQAA